jgi:hypothetical protein
MLQMIGDRLYTFVVANEYGSRIAAQCVGELIYAVVKVSVYAFRHASLLPCRLMPTNTSRYSTSM